MNFDVAGKFMRIRILNVIRVNAGNTILNFVIQEGVVKVGKVE